MSYAALGGNSLRQGEVQAASLLSHFQAAHRHYGSEDILILTDEAAALVLLGPTATGPPERPNREGPVGIGCGCLGALPRTASLNPHLHTAPAVGVDLPCVVRVLTNSDAGSSSINAVVQQWLRLVAQSVMT